MDGLGTLYVGDEVATMSLEPVIRIFKMKVLSVITDQEVLR